MEKEKIAKISALIMSLLILILSISYNNISNVALYGGCPIENHLLYHFFHVNIFHAIINVWSFLSVVFITRIHLHRIIFAFIFATLIPIDFLSQFIPTFANKTVGLSAVIFFIFASLSFIISNKKKFTIGMLIALAVGFFLPKTNAWLHLYCYIGGLLYGLIIKRIKRCSTK